MPEDQDSNVAMERTSYLFRKLGVEVGQLESCAKELEVWLELLLESGQLKPNVFLNFYNAYVSPEMMRILVHAIKKGKLPDGTEINFTKAFFSPEHVVRLFELNENTLSYFDSEKAMRTSDIYPDAENEVYLSNKKFDDKALELLVGAIKSKLRPSGLIINLESCNLAPKQVERLMNAVTRCESDEPLYINIAGNNLYHVKMKHVLLPIQTGMYPSNFTLDASNLDSGHQGMKLLKNAVLAHGTVLQKPLHLILRNNGYGGRCTKSASYIAEMIRSGNLPEKFELDLTGNHLSGKSFEIILEALSSSACPKRLKLNLSDNHLKDRDILKLKEALELHELPTDIEIIIDNNPISEEVLAALLEAKSSHNRYQSSFIKTGSTYQSNRFFSARASAVIDYGTCNAGPAFGKPNKGDG